MSDRGRPLPGESHRLAGWCLILVAVVAAVVGAGARFWPERLARWSRQPVQQLADWWLPGALAVCCVVALVVGGRLAFRRSARIPAQAKRAAGGNRLVEVAPVPVPAAAPVAAEAEADRSGPAAATDVAAFWPADQAVGMGWARASDAVATSPPPAQPVHPSDRS